MVSALPTVKQPVRGAYVGIVEIIAASCVYTDVMPYCKKVLRINRQKNILWNHVMTKKVSNIANKDNFLSKLNTTWAAIIAGCTLISMGFGAGFYVSDVFRKIEINEINQKHNEQLYNQMKNFDEKTEGLTHKVNLLEIENGKLREK